MAEWFTYLNEAAAAEPSPRPVNNGGLFGFFKKNQTITPPNGCEVDEEALKEVIQPVRANSPARGYYELPPVYRGSYSNLSPLTFDVAAVNNVHETYLDWKQLRSYDDLEVHLLLRLEHLLRLRKYWWAAKPRADEQWKTRLVIRSLFEAYCDCKDHGLENKAQELLSAWKLL